MKLHEKYHNKINYRVLNLVKALNTAAKSEKTKTTVSNNAWVTCSQQRNPKESEPGLGVERMLIAINQVY